jgi:hypothetical protein
VTGGAAGIIRLWEVASGKEVRRFAHDREAVIALCFTADGHMLGSVNEKGIIHLWEFMSGLERRRIEVTPGDVTALTISQSGRLLAGVATNRRLRLWSVPHEREMTLKELDRLVTAPLAISPRGWVVACADSESARCYNLGELSDDLAPRRLRWLPFELEELWGALGGDDPAKAYQAMWQMLDGVETTRFLRERLKPVPVVPGSRIKELIAALGTNPGAEKELMQILDQAKPALEQALTGKPAPEVRTTIAGLLDKAAGPITGPAELRLLRLIEVLEKKNNAEARQLLQRLSTGAPLARVTQRAREVLGKQLLDDLFADK